MIFSIHLVKDDWPYFLLLFIGIVVPISLSKIWPDLNWNTLQTVVGEWMLYNTPERKKKKKKSAERRFLNISHSLLDVWSYKKSLISALVTMHSATTGKLSNGHCEPDRCYLVQKSYLVISVYTTEHLFFPYCSAPQSWIYVTAVLRPHLEYCVLFTQRATWKEGSLPSFSSV